MALTSDKDRQWWRAAKMKFSYQASYYHIRPIALYMKCSEAYVDVGARYRDLAATDDSGVAGVGQGFAGM